MLIWIKMTCHFVYFKQDLQRDAPLTFWSWDPISAILQSTILNQFLYETCDIFIRISPKCVLGCPINNTYVLVQIMACRHHRRVMVYHISHPQKSYGASYPQMSYEISYFAFLEELWGTICRPQRRIMQHLIWARWRKSNRETSRA